MQRRRLFSLAGVILVVLAGAFLFWHKRQTRARALPVSDRFRQYLADPGMRMVAYSPAPDANAAEIAASLAVLRTRFDGLSLYGCDTQTVLIVQTARRLKFRAVLLTVWDPSSEPELAIASSVIRDSWTTTAMAVSIGSEGLMQKRYGLADLQAARAELLERTTSGSTVEMTTTEPWWLYLKPESGELRGFGEFTSVNVHVVWDTDIASPALAATWTRDRAAEVAAQLARPVLLRECGFPGGGSSPREGSTLQFSRELQQQFWESWSALGRRPPTAIFEGVDNQAKHWRGFEGKWGLLRADLQPWPAWTAFAASRVSPPQ